MIHCERISMQVKFCVCLRGTSLWRYLARIAPRCLRRIEPSCTREFLLLHCHVLYIHKARINILSLAVVGETEKKKDEKVNRTESDYSWQVLLMLRALYSSFMQLQAYTPTMHSKKEFQISSKAVFQGTFLIKKTISVQFYYPRGKCLFSQICTNTA